MRNVIKAAIFCAGAGLPSGPARGVEVYALYEKGCDRTVGALVQVGDDTASLMTFAGEIKSVPLKDVELVARYDILENPFARFAVGEGALAPLIVTSESSEGTFRAYASNFFEDLVLFFDDQGKIRVVEMDEIVAIVRDQTLTAPARALDHRASRILSPPGRERCAPVISAEGRGRSPEDRAATQIMADNLRLDSFWARMRSGYRDLESLRERTSFYARPLLFDDKTRLGLIAVETDRFDKLKILPQPFDNMPLYLEFGGGAAYRFQSSTSIGLKAWRMLPEIRPIGAIRSEFKSHLLHGILAANLSGFSAGKALYEYSWTPENSEESPRAAPWVDSTFNHLTLLGADYGPWSISYGYYFPDFALGQRNEFREITSSKASSVLRFGYQLTKLRYELFLFSTSLDGEVAKLGDVEDADQRRENRLVRFYSRRFVPEKARLKSRTARFDFSATFTKELSMVADLALARTDYQESAFRRNEALPDSRVSTTPDDGAGVPPTAVGETVKNKLSETSLGARLGARMDLGKWVALGAEACLEHNETRGQFQEELGEAEVKKTDQLTTYVVMMELLL